MKILQHLYKQIEPVKADVEIQQSFGGAYEELKKRCEELQEYVCLECRRGFDRPVGRKTHMRLKHPMVQV